MDLPKSIGIRLFDDSFVPVLTEGEVKNKRVLLTTVRDNQEKAIIELFEGNSDICSENEYLGKLSIDINRNTEKGEPGLEVNLRLDDDGILYAKAWDQESKEESEIVIEHSSTRQIIPETLTDDEINDLGDPNYQEINDYSADYQDTKLINQTEDYSYNEEKKNNSLLIIGVILGAIILIALLLFFLLGGNKKEKTVKEKKVAETVIEEVQEIEYEPEVIPPPVEKIIVEPKKEIMGTNKLEGKKYFVKRGDNLWNICKRNYKDPWYYPNLAELNGITNPRLIHAGTYIIIPPKSQVKRWDFSR